MLPPSVTIFVPLPAGTISQLLLLLTDLICVFSLYIFDHFCFVFHFLIIYLKKIQSEQQGML